jgi:alpha-L-fucosidase 2
MLDIIKPKLTLGDTSFFISSAQKNFFIRISADVSGKISFTANMRRSRYLDNVEATGGNNIGMDGHIQ